MLARIRKQLEEREDKGFTLVELLVVIIIIGILAAIAIPLYLNQQAKAKDSSLKSDLKNAQIAVATSLVDDPTGAEAEDLEFTGSNDATITLNDLNVDEQSFEICGTVPGGATDGGFCLDQDGVLTP